MSSSAIDVHAPSEESVPAPADLVLPEELFVIPDGQDYLLYVPRTVGVARVNGATVRHLSRVRSGSVPAASLPVGVVDDLVAARILLDRAEASQPIAFPQKTAFDPQGLTLILTTRCTMACTYCYANGGAHPKEMPWSVAKAGLDWLFGHARATGRPQASLMFHGGGEVTTARTMLEQCVSYARQQASTSGLTLSTSAGLNGVMRGPLLEWVIGNIDNATLSLDGLPAVHNAQRPLVTGKDSFPIVAAALHRMDDAGYQYGIRATVTRESLDRLVESVEFICRTFRARMIHLEPVFQVGRARDNDLGFPDPYRFLAAFRAAREVAGSYGRDLKYSGARFGAVTNKFCQVCDDLMAVTPDGHVTACYEVGELDDPRADTFFYGRLNADTAEIELDEAKLHALRSLTVENKSACADCFCKWTCAGECASKLALVGSAWETSGSPRCTVNRELTLDQMREYLARGGRSPDAPVGMVPGQ
jgi:uncharacterized protein